MKASDYIVQHLESIGIKNVYYLSGGMIMHLIESLRKSNLNLIPVLNEEDATMMSEADNIYVGKLNSVVIVTAGPGILNAVNAVASAYIDGNPLLVIGGQCKTADSKEGTLLRQKGIQEIDAVRVLSHITKYSTSVRRVGRIKYELEKSIYYATHERQGSVFLEIPLDIQGADIENSSLSSYNADKLGNAFVSSYFQARSALQFELETNEIHLKIDKVIELINNSKKPVILAGNGIRQSGALDLFKEIVDNLNIPILLTWKSKDFLTASHWLNFGMPGSISTRSANTILQECDLLISIGSRIDLPTCAYDYKNFAKNAKKVIVDIDNSEIRKLEFLKELEFHCDAKIFLEKLNERIIKINKDWDKWDEQCNMYQMQEPHYVVDMKRIVNPYYFIDKLSDKSDKNDIIVASSSGSASEMMCQSFAIKGIQRFISANGLGSMGSAISHAVGACISSGKQRTIVVEGDGSFAMNFKSIHLIKKYDLPIKIFIWNNNGYNSIKNTHNKFFNNADIINELTFPDIQSISQAYNIQYFKITSNEQILHSFYQLLNVPYNCFICEVMIDPTIETTPRVQSFIDAEGKIQSGKLENMYPYIQEK